MTQPNNQNSKLDKGTGQLPQSEGIARAGVGNSPITRPTPLADAPVPTPPPPIADMQNIPADYGLQQSENEGAALADIAFDAVEHAFQKRAQERAQRFVAMANATMASFAQGLSARSAEIRTTYLPESYSRRELPQGERD